MDTADVIVINGIVNFVDNLVIKTIIDFTDISHVAIVDLI